LAQRAELAQILAPNPHQEENSVLKALVMALFAVNIVFYGWAQGWLDTAVGGKTTGTREPERMTRQLRPEAVRILGAASSAAPKIGNENTQ
jgi:hypothetical protein